MLLRSGFYLNIGALITKRRGNVKSQTPNIKQRLCGPFEILNIGFWVLFVIWDLNIVI